MSFGVQQARQFLAPLQGKAVVFLVPDRRTNLLMGRLFLAAVAATGSRCFIFDMDSFYASNSSSLAEVRQQAIDGIRLCVPRVGADGEEAALGLFRGVEQGVNIVDSLNSLYHTFSADDQSSASRKLTFLIEALSFLSRTGRTTVLVTIYERDRPTFKRRGRLFTELGDATVSVKSDGETLILHCDRGSAWPESTLTIPTRPSG